NLFHPRTPRLIALIANSQFKGHSALELMVVPALSDAKDENAAWNILEKGLRWAGINTVGHPKINASGQIDLYLNQAIGLDKSAG
ncbi:MAG: hypothetical protein Q6L68_14120, partial [Thermostichus sp. DG02_5_bins_236]